MAGRLRIKVVEKLPKFPERCWAAYRPPKTPSQVQSHKSVAAQTTVILPGWDCLHNVYYPKSNNENKREKLNYCEKPTPIYKKEVIQIL